MQVVYASNLDAQYLSILHRWNTNAFPLPAPQTFTLPRVILMI